MICIGRKERREPETRRESKVMQRRRRPGIRSENMKKERAKTCLYFLWSSTEFPTLQKDFKKIVERERDFQEQGIESREKRRNRIHRQEKRRMQQL